MIKLNRTPPLYYLSLLLLLASYNVFSEQQGYVDQEPLMPEQAFVLSASPLDADFVRLQWNIAEGYYMYKSKFQFDSQTPGVEFGEPIFPKGKVKEDEFFGKVETYRNKVQIDIPIKRQNQQAIDLNIATVSQGCADLGVCYQPQKNTVKVSLAAASNSSANGSGLASLSNFGKKLGLGINEPTFLPADQVFIFSAEVVDNQTIKAHWDITQGYYLYKTKFKFDMTENGLNIVNIDLPAGKMKRDEAFGDMEVYYKSVDAILTLNKGAPEISQVDLNVGYQGCADAGFCYPPIKNNSLLNMAIAGGTGISGGSDGEGFFATFTDMAKLQAFMSGDNFLLTVLIFYMAGIGLAFTPCVFPMVPILSSIIAGEGANVTTGKAFNMSLIYVLAMAVTYTTIGIIAGVATSGLDSMFQNPWVLSSFALLFVLLSLSMFGYYNLQLPASFQSKLTQMSNRQQGGKMVGVGIMGFLSALIVGPCVAAPLAAAVLYIAEYGDPVFGGITLFAMSMGMGTPLVAIGTSAGKYLPRAGGWMDTVKGVFGLGLLGMAVYFLDRFLVPPLVTYLWLAWIVFAVIYLAEKIKLKDAGINARMVVKYAGIFATALLTFYLFVAQDNYQADSPAKNNSAEYSTIENVAGLSVIKVKGLKFANEAIQQAVDQGKGVMLDVYADWCTYCKQMDTTTFADARVQSELRKMVMIKIDITDDDDINQALRKHYNLRTPPPVYIFMDKTGKEIPGTRIYGYKNADQFLRRLSKANSI